MESEIIALIAGLSALITVRLVNLLKVPTRNVMKGDSPEAEEGRRAVVQGLAMVVGGLVVWACSWVAIWMIATLGEPMFKLIVGGILSSEGLHILKTWQPGIVAQFETITEEPKLVQ